METAITTVTTSKDITGLDANLLAGQCAPSTIAMYQRDAAAELAYRVGHAGLEACGFVCVLRAARPL